MSGTQKVMDSYFPVALATLIGFGALYALYSSTKHPSSSDDDDEEEVILSDSSSNQKRDNMITGDPILAATVAANPATNLDDEAQIIKNNYFLCVLSDHNEEKIKELCDNFCGIIINDISKFDILKHLKKTIYLCGNISKSISYQHQLNLIENIFIIKEISSKENSPQYPCISICEIPLLIHNVGILFKNFPFNSNHNNNTYNSSTNDIDDDDDTNKNGEYFNRIQSQHTFQSLTESNKPGTALRTGIYLSKVEKKRSMNNNNNKQEEDEEIHFNLLRCSSNLSGPTGNFQSTDHHIINSLNNVSQKIFKNSYKLNHVLAQIYYNKMAVWPAVKQTKAKIKEHSDKTKDMPQNGIMAFVTFYKDLNKLKRIGNLEDCDYGYKNTSGLTKLVFRLKKEVIDDIDNPKYACQIHSYQNNANSDDATTTKKKEQKKKRLIKKFSVLLSPNSVFFMPLSTNRLYTHEIVPSCLNADMLPTRMGYVVRCSNMKAIYKNNMTYIQHEDNGIDKGKDSIDKEEEEEDKDLASREFIYHMSNSSNLDLESSSISKQRYIKLEEPTKENMSALRGKYADENLTAEYVKYGHVPFSMNKGDYKKPFYDENNEFRIFSLNTNTPQFMNFNFNYNIKKNNNNDSATDGCNIFYDLLSSAPFEVAGKGRQGAVLVKPKQLLSLSKDLEKEKEENEEDENENNNLRYDKKADEKEEDDVDKNTINKYNLNNNVYPIVRTTTKYKNPAQCFQDIHLKLTSQIENIANLNQDYDFNNCLIEVYQNNYFNMGYHSDQALDLQEGSSIALFSCYEYPELLNELVRPPRLLVIERKRVKKNMKEKTDNDNNNDNEEKEEEEEDDDEVFCFEAEEGGDKVSCFQVSQLHSTFDIVI